MAFTSPPPSRKLHIVRIYGTNRDGDVLHDMWADVERIEQAKNADNPESGNWQGGVVDIKWHDDPNGEGYLPDGPASRKQTILKLCPPYTTDFSNPSEWIPLPVIDKMKVLRGDQGRVLSFINNNDSDTNSARRTETRRVPHYDTSIDDEVSAAVANDNTIKVWVLPAARYGEYVKNEDSKDSDQFILVEYIKWLKARTALTTQAGDQGQQVRVLSQYLIDNSDEPVGDEKHGDSDINPPYRLDPYQNIINVNWFADNFIVVTDVNNGTIYWSDDCKKFHKISGYPFFVEADPRRVFLGKKFPGSSSERGSIWNVAFVRKSKTFVVCGDTSHFFTILPASGDNPPVTVPRAHPKMMGSTNGKDWFDLTFPFQSFGTGGAPDDPDWTAFGLRYDLKPRTEGEDLLITANITAGGPPAAPSGDSYIQSVDGISWQAAGGTRSMTADDFWGTLAGGGCKLKLSGTVSDTYPDSGNSDGTPNGDCKVMRSTDGGKSFSIVDLGIGPNFVTTNVARANGVFVVCANKTTAPFTCHILTSEDGLNWSSVFTDTDVDEDGNTTPAFFSALASGKIKKN